MSERLPEPGSRYDLRPIEAWRVNPVEAAITDEQFRLMAAILDVLCTDMEAGIISHHAAFPRIGIGHCRLCGVLGQLVGDGDKAVYQHKASCIVSLNERLQQSLQGKQEDA